MRRARFRDVCRRFGAKTEPLGHGDRRTGSETWMIPASLFPSPLGAISEGNNDSTLFYIYNYFIIIYSAFSIASSSLMIQSLELNLSKN
jgi:hypothetical protein